MKGGVEGWSGRAETLRRLRWHCRRGLLELDVLLAQFARNGLQSLDDEELAQMESLLSKPDMDLLDWLEDRRSPPARFAAVISKIRLSV